jgi:hypothetical protein
MRAMTSRALKAIFAVSLGAISTAAFAQADYPTRPIKLIVPFTAGGGVDTVLSQFLTVDTEIPECMVGSYATSVLNCSASERFELQAYFACPLRIM